MTLVPNMNVDPMQKLKEMIIHISGKFEFEPKFGDTKLNKILFFSDYLAFGRFGMTITGESYTKQQFGPVCQRLLIARSQMIPNDVVLIEKPTVAGKPEHRTVPQRNANLAIFNGNEVATIDEVCEVFRDVSATAASEFSHKFRGWRTTKTGGVIQMETFFLPSEQIPEVSAKEIATLKRLEAKHGRHSASGEITAC